MNSTTQSQNNSLTDSWLKLGILSLGLAGFYSVILVVLRTPQLASFFSNPHIFKSALIIHVNLSVLIWLLSIIASIWSCVVPLSYRGSATVSRKKFLYLMDTVIKSRYDSIYTNIYPKLAFLATMLIALSPIAGNNPVMNNYIPMLENIIFILGLSLFGVTLLLYAINILYFFDWSNWNNLANFTILSTIIMFLLAWICFACSYIQLQNIIQIIPIDIEFYYELLFWSGGHLLQFIYTQIVMFIWIILFEELIGSKLKFQKFYLFLFYLNFVFGSLAVFGHIFYDIIDGAFKEFYTTHMKYLGGVAPVLCLVGMGLELIFLCHSRKSGNLEKKEWIPASGSVIKVALLCSITLFLLGGLIAINISGINVVIPAHYHGSIVGISIACMGYCYLSIGEYQRNCEHTSKKSAVSCRGMTFVIYPLTFGQILHILGLAFAGGYGVMRKDPSIVMPLSAKLLMGMMGGGGLISIVGGLMFVYICGKTIFLRR